MTLEITQRLRKLAAEARAASATEDAAMATGNDRAWSEAYDKRKAAEDALMEATKPALIIALVECVEAAEAVLNLADHMRSADVFNANMDDGIDDYTADQRDVLREKLAVVGRVGI